MTLLLAAAFVLVLAGTACKEPAPPAEPAPAPTAAPSASVATTHDAGAPLDPFVRALRGLSGPDPSAVLADAKRTATPDEAKLLDRLAAEQAKLAAVMSTPEPRAVDTFLREYATLLDAVAAAKPNDPATLTTVETTRFTLADLARAMHAEKEARDLAWRTTARAHLQAVATKFPEHAPALENLGGFCEALGEESQTCLRWYVACVKLSSPLRDCRPSYDRLAAEIAAPRCEGADIRPDVAVYSASKTQKPGATPLGLGSDTFYVEAKPRLSARDLERATLGKTTNYESRVDPATGGVSEPVAHETSVVILAFRTTTQKTLRDMSSSSDQAIVLRRGADQLAASRTFAPFERPVLQAPLDSLDQICTKTTRRELPDDLKLPSAR